MEIAMSGKGQKESFRIKEREWDKIHHTFCAESLTSNDARVDIHFSVFQRRPKQGCRNELLVAAGDPRFMQISITAPTCEHLIGPDGHAFCAPCERAVWQIDIQTVNLERMNVSWMLREDLLRKHQIPKPTGRLWLNKLRTERNSNVMYDRFCPVLPFIVYDKWGFKVIKNGGELDTWIRKDITRSKSCSIVGYFVCKRSRKRQDGKMKQRVLLVSYSKAKQSGSS